MFFDGLKRVTEAERQKEFSFIPDTMVQTPKEFTDALLHYANQNSLNLVITKEGMHPVFTMDGIEYEAERRIGGYSKFLLPTANIICRATHSEEIEQKIMGISPKRRTIMQMVVQCKYVFLIAVFALILQTPIHIVGIFTVIACIAVCLRYKMR